MFKAKAILLSLFLISSFFLFSQKEKKINELKSEIATSKNDTDRIIGLVNLSNNLSSSQFKDAIAYANEALAISVKNRYVKGQNLAYNSLADAYWFHSDYDKAQHYYFKAYRLSDSIHDEKGIAFSLYNIG